MSIRLTYLFGFVSITALLLFSLYLQFYAGIVPCPLCTLQRLSFAAIGFFSLLGYMFFNNRPFEFIIRALCILFTVVGMSFAIRQVWLQYFPHPNSNECGVSLQYMLQVLPLDEVARKIFAGTAECSIQSWQFLSLGMAEWATIWFAGFLGLYVIVLRYRK